MTTENRIPTEAEVEAMGLDSFLMTLYRTLDEKTDPTGIARRFIVQQPEERLAEFIKDELKAGTPAKAVVETIQNTMEGFMVGIAIYSEQTAAKDAPAADGVLDVDPEVPVNG